MCCISQSKHFLRRKNMKKRVLSVFLVLCFVLTLLPAAFADSAPTSGTCGKNVTWRLDGEGTLTISGSGEMEDYDYSTGVHYQPWYSIRNSIKRIVVKEGVTHIGETAFYDCDNVTSIILPNGLTSIGRYAFEASGGFESIPIPSSVTNIGAAAFRSCHSLANISLPNGITNIGELAFACCSIENIIIPAGISTIKYGLFFDCENLKSITIPVTVKDIEAEAFFQCYDLTDIYYKGTSAQWKNIKIRGNTNRLDSGKIKVHYTFSAPTVKITTSAGHPKIYWDATDYAVKYWVYRSTDGINYKYYDSTRSTSYTNISTDIGTTYYYKVKSVNEDGDTSAFSAAKSIQCKPAAPTVSINRSNGKPKLSWKAVSGATKYWIYRSTDGVSFKYYDSTTKMSYTNSGAASATKYYYLVKAVAVVNGKNVISAYSNTKSLFTSLATPSVSITTSNGKPKVTWKAVTGADKYYVYRSTDGKNFSYWDSTTKTSYINSGAKKNTKYYYKVKAVCASNSNANSAQSSAVSIKATK